MRHEELIAKKFFDKVLEGVKYCDLRNRGLEQRHDASITRQWLSKHCPVAHATAEGEVFCLV
jgi:hypothetical protein